MMGATKRNPIQEMSLKRIRVDHALQSRVITSQDTVKDYADALLAGAFFPPVIVFFDGKTYWLADGFHRHESYKKAGRSSIPAEIKEGGRREALLHSAGANIKMGMRPTRDDRRKAVEMLFSDPEYGRFGVTKIARICGVSPVTVKKYQAEWYAAQGLEIPTEIVIQSEGWEKPRIMPSTKRSRGRFSDPQPAIMSLPSNSRLSGAMSAVLARRDESALEEKALDSPGDLSYYLCTHRVAAKSFSKVGMTFGGVELPGALCVPLRSIDRDSLLISVASLVLLRKQIEIQSVRLIVVCRRDRAMNQDSAVMRICALEPLPIEFMTVREVAEAFGPKARPPGEPTDEAEGSQQEP